MEKVHDWLTESQGGSLAEDLDLLLGDVCVGWGYCNYTVFGRDLVKAGGGVVTAATFARAVMEADGEDPSAVPARCRMIGRLFQYRYGAESISEANYAPGATPPYTIPPPVDSRDVASPDPILLMARDHWRREASGQASHGLAEVDLDDVIHSLKAARARKWFCLRPEFEAARQDLNALIFLYETLSGKFWNSDPDGRRRLGLGSRPATLAEPDIEIGHDDSSGRIEP